MRHMAVICLAGLALFQTQASHSEELRSAPVWATVFDMGPYYKSLPDDASPVGSVEMSCQIVDVDGYVSCRVDKSTLKPDNGYAKRVAVVVGQTGRIDMSQTPDARVGSTFPLYLDFVE